MNQQIRQLRPEAAVARGIAELPAPGVDHVVVDRSPQIPPVAAEIEWRRAAHRSDPVPHEPARPTRPCT